MLPLSSSATSTDASADQHRVFIAAHEKGAVLRVFADPKQRIFGERSTAAETGATALKGAADSVAVLDTPHRWSRGCGELGRWTLDARRSLLDGLAVDLRDGHRPQSVQVVDAVRPFDSSRQSSVALPALRRH